MEYEAAHRNEGKDNPLHKHDMIEHDGEVQEYKATVLERHTNEMKRRISKYMIIEKRRKTQKILNSKTEEKDTIDRNRIGEKSKRAGKDKGRMKRLNCVGKENGVNIPNSPNGTDEANMERQIVGMNHTTNRDKNKEPKHDEDINEESVRFSSRDIRYHMDSFKSAKKVVKNKSKPKDGVEPISDDAANPSHRNKILFKTKLTFKPGSGGPGEIRERNTTTLSSNRDRH